MAALLRRSTTSQARCQCQRAFSTSAPRAVSLQWDKNDPEALKDALPEYPYGPTRWYKQSARGLYGGQRVQFGNNVGEKFKTKTRRRWDPNVQTKRLWSRALNRFVQIRVTTRVLRTIDKLGGLDEYLLGEKEARIKELGESGWWLRWAIMQTPAIKKKFEMERAALGLPEDPEMIEAVEEDLEASSLEETSSEDIEVEPVDLDETFQIEHNPDLPPLKFRVGKKKHIMLTANGWVRTRPNPERWANMDRDKIRERFAVMKEARLQIIKSNLEKMQERAKLGLPELQRKIEDLETATSDLGKASGELKVTINYIERVLEGDPRRIKRALKWHETKLGAEVVSDATTSKDIDASDDQETLAEKKERLTSIGTSAEAQLKELTETIERNVTTLKQLRTQRHQLTTEYGTPQQDDVLLSEDEQTRVFQEAKKALNRHINERVEKVHERNVKRRENSKKFRPVMLKLREKKERERLEGLES